MHLIADNLTGGYICVCASAAQTAQKKECGYADPRGDNLSHKTGVGINTHNR